MLSDSDYDGLSDSIDPCPIVFGPSQRINCNVPDESRRALPLAGMAARIVITDPSSDAFGLGADHQTVSEHWSRTHIFPTPLEYVIQRPRRRGLDVDLWFPAPEDALPPAALVSANTLTLPFIGTATLVPTDQTQAAVVEPTRIGAPEKQEAVSRATPFVFARSVNRVFTLRQDEPFRRAHSQCRGQA